MTQSKNILITGSSGFVGRHLCGSLSDFGSGWAISRQRCGSSLPLRWQWKSRECALKEKTPGIDLVIHLETKQHVFYPTGEDSAAFERINVGGTAEWLDWCSRNQVPHFVYFSSIKAVQHTASGPNGEEGNEIGTSSYGASKWKSEQLVRKWTASDARRCSAILRPAPIYGPGSAGNIAAMVSAIVRRRFFLVGRNENIKSAVSIGNVTAATRFVVERMAPGCEVFNLIDEESWPVRKLDATIRKMMGWRGNSPTVPFAIAKAAALAADASHYILRTEWPLNSRRLSALIETSHFRSDKLRSVGFLHPETSEMGLRRLVESLKAKK